MPTSNVPRHPLRRIIRWARTSWLEILTLLISIPLLIWVSILAYTHLVDHWYGDSFKLFLDTLGILAGATVFLVIYTAIRAERINRSLIETQTVSAKAVTGFRQLFERHLLKHFNDSIRGDDELEEVDLILSTPAFGLHPLSGKRCNEFIQALQKTTCGVDIILFTPDAHFQHFFNTLVWEEKRDTQRTSLWELAYYTSQFIHVVKDGTTNKGWYVWPSNNSDKRIFHFQTTRQSHLYLVLSDDVSISTDLKEFRGRSLPLPSILREAVVGGKYSIFDKYKSCPFTTRFDADAALSTKQEDEFGLLLADYLLARTSQIILSYPTFKSELIGAARRQGNNREKISPWLNALVRRYLEYLKRIGIDNKTKDPITGGTYDIAISITGDERRRIELLSSQLKHFVNESNRLTNSNVKSILTELQPIIDTSELQKDALSGITDENNEATAELLMILVYSIARSGMERSEYMRHRIQEAST